MPVVFEKFLSGQSIPEINQPTRTSSSRSRQLRISCERTGYTQHLRAYVCRFPSFFPNVYYRCLIRQSTRKATHKIVNRLIQISKICCCSANFPNATVRPISRVSSVLNALEAPKLAVEIPKGKRKEKEEGAGIIAMLERP